MHIATCRNDQTMWIYCNAQRASEKTIQNKNLCHLCLYVVKKQKKWTRIDEPNSFLLQRLKLECGTGNKSPQYFKTQPNFIKASILDYCNNLMKNCSFINYCIKKETLRSLLKIIFFEVLFLFNFWDWVLFCLNFSHYLFWRFA